MVIRRTDHPSRFRWPSSAIKRLGEASDLALAKRLRIHPSTVAAERRRRGIPPYRRTGPIDWTDEKLSLLGTDSDARIAARLGVAVSTVTRKRQDLDISPCFPQYGYAPRQAAFWTPDRDALLGTESDQKIADQLGIPIHRVTYRRQRLGIPPACPRPRYDWNGVDDLLGTEPDARIAERFGMNLETIRRRRLKLGVQAYQSGRRTIVRDAALKRLLETQPTGEIDAISSSAASQLRQELDISPPPGRTRWTEAVLARLGREPDEDIARELGLAVDTVGLKRCELGRQKRPFRRWTEEELAILEQTEDDREAARLLERTVKAIRHARDRLRRTRSTGAGVAAGETAPRKA